MSGGTRVCQPPAAACGARAAEGRVGTVYRAALPAVGSPVQSEAPVPVLPSHYRGTRMPHEWPLSTSLELGALPGAVPCARLHAKQVLWEWGFDELSDNVELLVSELVTNAVRASREFMLTPVVRLWLLSDNARVLILVWDANPRPPVRIDASGDAECGRGLLLVETMSKKWGSYPVWNPAGKVVWALVGTPST